MVRPLPLVRQAPGGLRQVVELAWPHVRSEAVLRRSRLLVQGDGEEREWSGEELLARRVAEGPDDTAAGEGSCGESPVWVRIDVPACLAETPERGRYERRFRITWWLEGDGDDGPVAHGAAPDGAQASWEGDLPPVQPWTVFVVCHSHTDVGFTHPASEVARIHAKNLELAMAAIEATAGWPEPARFRWTVEAAWQLEHFRRTATGAEMDRLVACLRDGNIELTALYLHEHFDLLGKGQIRRVTHEAEQWRRLGVPVDTAMIADVPGVTRGILPVLRAAGVRYLAMAPNNFAAPFHAFGPPPRPFRWRGPDDSEVLVWYTGDPYWAYIEGVRYGLRDSLATAEVRLPRHLAALEAQGYPYAALMLQLAFDNDRLHVTPAAVCRAWGESYRWPRLVMATPRMFFRHMEAAYGEAFPAVEGDWPSYWVQSAGAYPRELAASRRAHQMLEDAEHVATLADAANEAYRYPHDVIDQAYRDLLTFDEHSGLGGLWVVHSQRKREQADREGLAYLKRPLEAIPRLLDEAVEALSEKVQPHDNGSVLVINPTALPVKAPAVLRLDPAAGGNISRADRLPGWQELPGPWPMADAAQASPGQRYWLKVVEVPPGGLLRLPFEPMAGGQGSVDDTGRLEAAPDRLANERIEVRLGDDRPIASIVARATGEPFVEAAPLPFGAVLLYRPDDPRTIPPGGDFQARRELYEGVPVEGRVVHMLPAPSDDGSGRRSLPLARELVLAGPEAACVRCAQADPAGWAVSWEVWLYRGLPRVDLVVSVQRPRPEASGPTPRDGAVQPGDLLYLALPFAMPEVTIRHQVPGGWAEPGAGGQIPGSCMDTYAVADWIRLIGGGKSVVVSSLDAPLVEYDAIQAGRFLRGDWRPTSGRLFFRLAQASARWDHLSREDPGRLTFRFSLWLRTSVVSDREATVAGAAAQHPLIARYLPSVPPIPNAWQPGPPPLACVEGTDAVLLDGPVRLQDPGAYLLWLVETAGRACTVDVVFPRFTLARLERATPAGHPLGPAGEAIDPTRYRLRLAPYQAVALRATLLR